MAVGDFLKDLETYGIVTIKAAQIMAEAAKVTNALIKIPDLLFESQSPRLLRIAVVEELNPSILTGVKLE